MCRLGLEETRWRGTGDGHGSHHRIYGLQTASKYLPPDMWINPGQWLMVWNGLLGDMLERLCRDIQPPHEPLWARLARAAVDPNAGRVPTRQAFARPSMWPLSLLDLG